MRLLIIFIFCGYLISGCVPYSAIFPQRVAQPDTPAARNFTSFSASLRCMDDLLASGNHPRVLISSTGIPDLTKKISVSADDMLVNAISSMNRRSQTYLFVDQSLEKESGQIALFTPQSSAATPTLYIRGAISQVDTPTGTNVTVDGTNLDDTRPVASSSINIDRGTSIVSVDMHLVSFPSKTVVPGSSVANSMVVTGRGFGLGASGVIDLVSLSTTIEIDRVESMGQAVRNLVELGAIELIGRHANVQYWECLNIPAVKTRLNERKEFIFSSADKIRRIPEAQKMLSQLGFYSGPVTGIVDQHTRDSLSHFQAAHGLIATGDLNYDTFQQLQERTKGYAPKRRVAGMGGRFNPQVKRPLIITSLSAEPTPSRLEATARTTKRDPIFGGLISRRQTEPKSLILKSEKSRYKKGDVLRAELISPTSGYLTCFHQSKGGSITQIFPKNPKATFAIAAGEVVELPDTNAGFDIIVESSDWAEDILCVVETGRKPADISKIAANKTLAPMRVDRFDALIAAFKTSSADLLTQTLSIKAR